MIKMDGLLEDKVRGNSKDQTKLEYLKNSGGRMERHMYPFQHHRKPNVFLYVSFCEVL